MGEGAAHEPSGVPPAGEVMSSGDTPAGGTDVVHVIVERPEASVASHAALVDTGVPQALEVVEGEHPDAELVDREPTDISGDAPAIDVNLGEPPLVPEDVPAAIVHVSIESDSSWTTEVAQLEEVC